MYLKGRGGKENIYTERRYRTCANNELYLRKRKTVAADHGRRGDDVCVRK